MRELTELEVLQVSGGSDPRDFAVGAGANWIWPTPPLGFDPPIFAVIAPSIGTGPGFAAGSFSLGGYPLASEVQMVDASMSLQ